MKLLLLLLLGLTSQSCLGYDGGYSSGYEPFAAQDGVRQFPVSVCKEDASTGYWYVEGHRANYPTFKQIRQDDDETDLVFRLADDRQLRTKGEDCLGPYINEAYCGDLNGDHLPDFAIVIGSSGCGLASEYRTVIFALSSGSSYRFTKVRTMGFGPDRLIDYRKDGKCQLIHCSFVEGELGRDGKDHNYWVYNFYEIENDRIKRGSFLPQKWIMYTYHPNHRDTTQLSEQQKERLWRLQKSEVFSE